MLLVPDFIKHLTLPNVGITQDHKMFFLLLLVASCRRLAENRIKVQELQQGAYGDLGNEVNPFANNEIMEEPIARNRKKVKREIFSEDYERESDIIEWHQR